MDLNKAFCMLTTITTIVGITDGHWK